MSINRTFSVFALLLCWASYSLAAPYGEWGIGVYGFGEMRIPVNEANPAMVMPEKGDVGFPAYPDSKIILVAPAGHDGLCTIIARTTASVREVCNFYRTQFKASDGYTIRSGDETQCSYVSDKENFKGVGVILDPEPMFAYKNGLTAIAMNFNPKNGFSCSGGE